MQFSMKTVLPDTQQSLAQWVSQATGINTFGVKIRLLGNDLHILCEAVECPQRWQMLSDLLKALQQTDLDALTKANQVGETQNREQPSIYQVFVYGRKKGEQRPQWCHRVYLNQIDRHLEQVEKALVKVNRSQIEPGGALIVSNESLARQGKPEAIARYLSETLSPLGIDVQVKVRPHKSRFSQNPDNFRLWVFCQSAYSPDPQLIAEPVAAKLRHLNLTGYGDAIIANQVQGESKPDWLLRIDLTPPERMLKEWSRWGDVQAISRLLAQELSTLQAKVTVTLKDTTLHIFCSPASSVNPTYVPPKQRCLEIIGKFLESIAPQAITAATVYGQTQAVNDTPAWIDWLSLPAKEHPALAQPVLELASCGDEPAILFLIERLLNPNLDWRLKTGGIRVLLSRRGDLLHIMCDAPICPQRKQVVHPISKLIRELRIPGIAGIRIYGRRAGSKEPFWNYGTDFQARDVIVPEPTPEFAATSAYVQELLPTDNTEATIRPDLTKEDLQTFVTTTSRAIGDRIRQFLLSSQLFAESLTPGQTTYPSSNYLTLLVWGTLGILLTVQADWLFHYVITRTKPDTPLTQVTSPTPPPPTNNPNQFTTNSPSVEFNASGFTTTNPTRGNGTATAILLAARSPIPTFNARQLDEQLALYKQRLQEWGNPPDVLIIGSSRALRGVDPDALAKSLKNQGYSQLNIFNFGINGATAQVVDFILRQVLAQEELPKMIIWADGARAFNSGRDDLTFNAIAASPGYQYAIEQAIKRNQGEQTSDTAELTSQPAKNHSNSYQIANNWLNERVSNLFATYPHRQELKRLITDQIKFFPGLSANNPASNSPDSPLAANQTVDFDGFLALSDRFDPSTYYQKHPRVPGNYDNDYKSFLLSGQQDAALQAILQFANTQKISLVFVNMPLSNEYLDQYRTIHEQEFQQYMLQIASENSHFIFRDLSLLFPTQNQFFSDPSHLNQYGAYEVSKKLATDPMIPWKIKQRESGIGSRESGKESQGI